jgi:phenylalanyl-tRNA synthetase beta subunit
LKERSELSKLQKTLKSLERGREGFKAISAMPAAVRCATIVFDEDVERNTIMSHRLN